MATEGKDLSNTQNAPNGKSLKIAVLTSEWNSTITFNLQKGCIDALTEAGVEKQNIFNQLVPGSFELPQAASILAEKNHFDAIICLGSVIRGETAHFDFVCQGVSFGIQQVSIKYNIPVVFGVLTDDNEQQAKDRSGGKHGNKGVESAVTALKMANLKKNLLF